MPSTELNIMASRVAARNIMAAGKYKKKTKDSEGNTQYEYSEKQVSHRNNEKASRIEGLRKIRTTLISQVKKDYKSKDLKTRMTALVVGLLDHTYERVGNDQSAKEGHFGVTGWQAKHIKFSGSGATLNYVGKSGVKQTKEVKDPGAVALLKELSKGKSGSDCLFEHEGVKVSGEDVNAYLPEGITAKDLRGLHANEEMRGRLKAVRSKGPSLPSDPKAREKILKKELATALEETAQLVGHEPSTLKSQYLVPKMVDIFLQSGKVIDKLKVSNIIDLYKSGTKDEFEKDQEQVEDLLRPEPPKKPPRHDLRKRTLVEDDPDLEKANATNDRDLSQNYKKIGKVGPGADERLYPHMTQKGMVMAPYNDLTDDEKSRITKDRSKDVDKPSALKTTAPKIRPTQKITKPEDGAKRVKKPEDGAKRVKKPEDVKTKRPSKSEDVKPKRPSILDGLIRKMDQLKVDQEADKGKGKPPTSKSVSSPDDPKKRKTKKEDPEFFAGPEVPEKGKKKKDQEKGKAPKGEKPEEGAKKKAPPKKAPKKKAPAKKKKSPADAATEALSKDEITKIINEAVTKALSQKQPTKKDPAKKAPKKKPSTSRKPKSDKSEGVLLAELISNPQVARILEPIVRSLGEKPTPKSLQKALEKKFPDAEVSLRSSRNILQNFMQGKGLLELMDTAKDLLKKEDSSTNRQVATENVERVQTMLDETLSGAHLPNQEKKRFLNLTQEMSPQDQKVVLKTMRRNLESRMGDTVDSEAIQGHLGVLRDTQIPTNPKDMGDYLADRLYAQNVVFNPFLTAGIPISDQPKSDSELETRASQAYDQFRDLGPKHRDRAARQLHGVLQEIDPNAPAAQELKAISDGIALASTLKGESTEGLPPPSHLLTSVARGLEKRGEERNLLGAMDPNSPDFREELKSHIQGLSDEELREAIAGDPVLEVLGDQLLESKGELRRETRQMIEDVMVDHTKNVDTMIRDGLEDKNDVERAFDQQEREKIQKEISQDQTSLLMDIKAGLDKETQNQLRLNMMEATLRRITNMFGSMKKSMSRAVARKATNERDLNFLDHRTSSSISKPKITSTRVKSTSKVPRAVSRYQQRRDLLKPKGKKANQSFLYSESQLNQGPRLKTAEPNSTRGYSEMSKTLTKQGAFQISQDLDKLAHVVQHDWEALGLPEKLAQDFALRCDMVNDAIEKKAFTEAPMTIKNDSGAKVPGTLKEDNTNADSPKQKFDPADIAKVKAPTRQESDEPYMDAFTQDEFHQLENVQTSGGFSNAKAAKLAEAIVEALA